MASVKIAGPSNVMDMGSCLMATLKVNASPLLEEVKMEVVLVASVCVKETDMMTWMRAVVDGGGDG